MSQCINNDVSQLALCTIKLLCLYLANTKKILHTITDYYIDSDIGTHKWPNNRHSLHTSFVWNLHK